MIAMDYLEAMIRDAARQALQVYGDHWEMALADRARGARALGNVNEVCTFEAIADAIREERIGGLNDNERVFG